MIVATTLKQSNDVKDLNIAGKEKLLAWAASLGFTETDVRGIMLAHDVTTFSIDSYSFYVGIIRMAWEEKTAQAFLDDNCPVCGAMIRRDKQRDNRFGARWGWRCSESRFHFIEFQVNKIREKQIAYGSQDRDTDEQASVQNPE